MINFCIDWETAERLKTAIAGKTGLEEIYEDICGALDNYEPGDTADAWEGGFAANH